MEKGAAHRKKQAHSVLLYIVVPLLLIGIACVRLYPTYTIFTGTIDEPSHIVCGLQWLDKGAYTYDRQHPPLARLAVAIGPYWDGITSGTSKADRTYPADVLTSRESYFRDLTFARMGNLPFLVLSCIVVYLWASRWFNRAAALWALVLFTCLPTILGHAAIATLDVACAATVAAALYQFLRWLETPQTLRALVLGLAISLAVLSKFSSLVFLPASFGFAIVYLLVAKRDVLVGNEMLSTRLKQVGIMASAAFFVVWAGYKFSLNAISPRNVQHTTVDAHIGNPPLRRAAYALLELPLPLLEIKDGIEILSIHNGLGHPSYLLGEYRTTGWWYFFPVVVAVKTPLAFLILTAAGSVALFRRRAGIPWQQILTAIFPIAIFLVCMVSSIDLGVRHILSIYPMLSVLAGFGMARLTDNLQPRVWLAVGYLLLGWAVLESIIVHPDYLAYFNQIAGRHPEAIVCESDLDWGQDLHRLSARLRARGVKEVAIRYFGTFPLDKANLPPYRDVPPYTPISGYVAISIRDLVLENARDGSFGWLKQYEPIEKIGRTIYLFQVPVS
jgi:4-amino-4-deoxy-L-arabinose transferase-like glycosyltransferase